jgi:predicted branched-subunit amino acid permease
MESFAALRRDPEFARGRNEMVGIALGIAAWGLVTGVAMVKSGMDVPLALLMSFVVFAGSAQLAVLPLLAAAAPLWVVWATAFCINLRFVIFSAGWRPYFGHLPLKDRLILGYFSGDLNYVNFMRRFPQPQPAPGQQAYFWGSVATNWFAWQGASIAGILLADRVPTAWGLGFAGTMALLALVYSLLNDRVTWLAAAVASGAAVAAYALPLKLNIVVAIVAAVVVGLIIDHTTPREAEPAQDLT